MITYRDRIPLGHEKFNQSFAPLRDQGERLKAICILCFGLRSRSSERTR